MLLAGGGRTGPERDLHRLLWVAALFGHLEGISGLVRKEHFGELVLLGALLSSEHGQHRGDRRTGACRRFAEWQAREGPTPFRTNDKGEADGLPLVRVVVLTRRGCHRVRGSARKGSPCC